MTDRSDSGRKPFPRWRHERIVWGALLGGLLATLIYASQGSTWQEFASVAAVAIVISGAALLSGGLLGFLFGIPRALQQDHASVKAKGADAPTGVITEDQGATAIRYSVNTNLEQISDWLTKIIVGVGLTQVSSIPGAIANYADSTRIALGDYSGSPVFSVALLCYHLIGGFVIGYLGTRLYLPGAFRQADVEAIGDKLKSVERKLTGLEKQTEIDARALAMVTRQLNPTPGDEPVSQPELNEAIRAASESIRAQGFYSAYEVRSANWRNLQDKPKMERTIPIFRALIDSDVEDVYHLNHGQLGFALKDQRRPNWEEACAELSKAIELRGPWQKMGWVPYEFCRAQCRINTDPLFREDSPTDEVTKQEILADLMIASQDELVRGWIADTPEIVSWIQMNGVVLPSSA